MRSFTKLVLAVCIAFSGLTAHADSYDPATNKLTVDSVTIGGINYTAVITVGSVISVSPIGGGPCNSNNISLSTYNAIQVGMSFDQVSQAVGCKNTTEKTLRTQNYTAYTWEVDALRYITVFFDSATGTKVTLVGTLYKMSTGF